MDLDSVVQAIDWERTRSMFGSGEEVRDLFTAIIHDGSAADVNFDKIRELVCHQGDFTTAGVLAASVLTSFLSESLECKSEVIQLGRNIAIGLESDHFSFGRDVAQDEKSSFRRHLERLGLLKKHKKKTDLYSDSLVGSNAYSVVRGWVPQLILIAESSEERVDCRIEATYSLAWFFQDCEDFMNRLAVTVENRLRKYSDGWDLLLKNQLLSLSLYDCFTGRVHTTIFEMCAELVANTRGAPDVAVLTYLAMNEWLGNSESTRVEDLLAAITDQYDPLAPKYSDLNFPLGLEEFVALELERRTKK